MTFPKGDNEFRKEPESVKLIRTPSTLKGERVREGLSEFVARTPADEGYQDIYDGYAPEDADVV
jgi:hypothetical protein